MRSPKAWSIFANFYEITMRRKEEDERARERGLVPLAGALVPAPVSEDSEEES